MVDPTRTERRLRDSIRRAKASPESGKAVPESGEASPAVDSPAPRRDTAARAQPMAPSAGARESEARGAVPVVAETDPYQSGRRVWPD
jgi:hypothetical protein